MTEHSKKKRKRVPKKITPGYLENSCLYYLSRFTTSEENLRRVMMRKVFRSANHHGTNPDEGKVLIEDIISRYLRSGILDDKAYAKAKATALHRRGNSSRNIQAKLKQKGLNSDVIDIALAALREVDKDPERTAAIRFARRRRLGPFQFCQLNDELRKKHLAAMARAGFSYDIAKLIIFAAKEDDLKPYVNEES